MAKSKIEWTDRTWNPSVGCTRVSSGCKNCYAFDVHDKRHRSYLQNGGKWPNSGKPIPPQYAEPFKVVQLLPERLRDPLGWRSPQRVFVDSMSDLFHPEVPDKFIDQVFAVMALASQHTFMVLTKRPERMCAFLNDPDRLLGIASESFGIRGSIPKGAFHEVMLKGRWPLPNVWLGTSTEDQKTADQRIPHLLETPAAVRFLSCEPLLGPIDLEPYLWEGAGPEWAGKNLAEPGIDWVITGGESGAGARPALFDWYREIRDDCERAGVAYFHKQHGEWVEYDIGAIDDDDLKRTAFVENDGSRWYRDLDAQANSGLRASGLECVLRVGKKVAGRLLDGREHNEFPEVNA